MIEFLKKLFGSAPPSSSTAKERLRLVLMTDHLALAPEIIDAMKRDLVDVISRYVEVDRDRIEVNFEQQDKALAMLANIPIISVNRPNGGVPEKIAPKPEPELVAAAAAPRIRRRAADPSPAPPQTRAKRRCRRTRDQAGACALREFRGDADARKRSETLRSKLQLAAGGREHRDLGDGCGLHSVGGLA